MKEVRTSPLPLAARTPDPARALSAAALISTASDRSGMDALIARARHARSTVVIPIPCVGHLFHQSHQSHTRSCRGSSSPRDMETVIQTAIGEAEKGRRLRPCSPLMRLLKELDTNDTRSKACDIPSKHEGRMLSGGGRLRGNGRRPSMRMPVVALLGLAALALAPFFAISPNTTTSAREASIVSGIDILDLTKKAKSLPEQHFPAH
jgi:hypothetical protein